MLLGVLELSHILPNRLDMSVLESTTIVVP